MSTPLTLSSFLDAKEALLKGALIDRSSEDETLTVHRLIQAAVMKRLSSQERMMYFDHVILLLSNGFPNTWNTVTSHQFKAWGQCEKCLPHVSFLIAQSKKYSLRASDSKKFAELILRCCWYASNPRSRYEQLMFIIGTYTNENIILRLDASCKARLKL